MNTQIQTWDLNFFNQIIQFSIHTFTFFHKKVLPLAKTSNFPHCTSCTFQWCHLMINHFRLLTFSLITTSASSSINKIYLEHNSGRIKGDANAKFIDSGNSKNSPGNISCRHIHSSGYFNVWIGDLLASVSIEEFCKLNRIFMVPRYKER